MSCLDRWELKYIVDFWDKLIIMGITGIQNKALTRKSNWTPFFQQRAPVAEKE
jgi:hypothetical protein